MSDLSSQVTIGSGTRPHEFSVLELISNSKGLRLPQMSKEDKIKAFGSDDAKLKALTSPEKEAAMGLQIFNLSTQCVETWNGEDWNFWDLYKGAGNDVATSLGDYAGATNNTWEWRTPYSAYNTGGGALITNDAGEILFISAVGGRTFSSGATTYNGYGEYWSSTGSSGPSPFSACWMELSETSVYIRSNSSISKSHGLSVRCVKD